MNFLNPIFLVGLASTVIPLLIYLWSKRRKNEIEFSSLFLFRRIESSSIRSIKITEWLLILLRILGLLFFVLAFSQPFISDSTSPLLNKKYDQILFDESPGFYFQNGSSRKKELKNELIQFVQSYSKENPETKFFSTDSLSDFRFTLQNDDLLSLFHGTPSDMDSSKPTLVVTKKNSELTHINRLKSADFISLDDASFSENIGIVSVKFPDLIWQVSDANQVQVVLQKSKLSPSKFGLEVWVDRQLNQTVFVDMTGSDYSLQVPVQVQSRGWHELKIKLNVSDFPLDNEWNGGFYLPDQISVDFKMNLNDINFSPSAFQSAAENSGLKLDYSASFSSDKSALVVSSFLKTSVKDLISQYNGLIWIPDFKYQTSIKNQLSELGFTVQSISSESPQTKSLSASLFWSFLKTRKMDLAAQPVSNGLISLFPSGKIEFLAFNENNKPVLGLTHLNGKTYFIFLTNPFDKTLTVNIWAIGTLFHALSVLSQNQFTDGFSSITTRSGNQFVINRATGKVTVELADKQFEIEPIGPFPYHLPAQSVFTAGVSVISETGKIIQKTGINYPLKLNSQENPKIVYHSWVATDSFPLLNNKSGWELAAWFFALSLCCFVTESLVSQRKR